MSEKKDESVSLEEIALEADDRMQRSLDMFQRDLTGIRSSRASISMVDHINVEYYGSMCSLNQLATVNIPEPRMIVITPFDKGSISAIEKSILKSDLNITPQNDGNVIRLILPELSGERRQELVKQVKNRLEECKVAIRNIRRDSNEEIKKQAGKSFSEDQIKQAQNEIQELTDKYGRKADELAQAKEKSILTV